MAAPIEYSVFFLKLSFLGIITLPVFFLFFALDYAGSPWLPKLKKLSKLLWVIPACSIVLMLTNRWHGLFWSEVYAEQAFQDTLANKYVPGTWFLIHAVYSYGLVIMAVGILLVALGRQREWHGQYALLIAVTIPLASSILYVTGLTAIDYSPLTLSFTILVTGWAISSRFFMSTLSELESLQSKTNELNKLYNIVVKVSERLVQTETGHMEGEIHNVLRDLGEIVNVDRTYIFSFDAEKDEVSNTYEWCKEGIPSEKENLQNIPFEKAIPRWRKLLMDNRHVYIPLVSELPEDHIHSEEKKILEPQGIQSLIVVPMFNGKDFVGFDSVLSPRKWDYEIIALLKLCANIIGGNLARMQYENQLMGALETAEAATRAKAEFLANMSHELRTPLTAIIGFASIVAEDPGDEDAKKHLEIVEASSKSLLRIINDLLFFSRMEAGALKMEPAPASLEGLLGFVKDTFLPRIKEKNLNMELILKENTRQIFYLDEGRLRQVLLNIVGNAVKFTEKGHVNVIAEALPEDGDASVKSDNPPYDGSFRTASTNT